MTDILQQFFTWEHVGIATAWLVTILLMISGLVGCVVPALPGHLLLFIAAIAHHLMLGKDGSGLEWSSFVILALLMGVAQIMETLSGALGARWFGGTRWGALGAIIGGLVGMFFFPFGLVIGPLVGAIACELAFAKKDARPATLSGVGSVVGTLAGIGIKIAIGILMVLWFVVDVFWLG